MASAVSSIGGAAKSKYALLIVFQVILIILYGIFVRYDIIDKPRERPQLSGSLYAMFQDIHVMIFIGFGFLMTFLRKYGYSALGFNWLIGAIVVQWSLLCQNFYHMDDGKIKLTLLSLAEADIMAATVLISFGALLGRTTGPQLLVMAVVETAVGCTNLYIMTDVIKIADCGGSIAIHTFGAYFGLAASMVMKSKKTNAVADQNGGGQEISLEGASYSSDITAMIGSIFLWIFWPSFNAALLTEDNEQYKAVVNTYLSLAAATLTAFVISSMVTHERKFDMVHVQNSTLAGGVAVGSVSNMYVHPFGALAIGMGAGVLSVIGYKFLTPKLDSKLGLKDTCGVHNLHGMPGVYSGILSAIFAALATTELYGTGLYSVFGAMSPSGDGRTAQTQALYQLLGLAVTLLIAIISGAITGRIMSLPLFEKMGVAERYDDARHWELPTVDDVTKTGTHALSEQIVELAGAPKY